MGWGDGGGQGTQLHNSDSHLIAYFEFYKGIFLAISMQAKTVSTPKLTVFQAKMTHPTRVQAKMTHPTRVLTGHVF